MASIKDYEAIARGFSNAANADRTPRRLWALETAAHYVASELAALDPGFRFQKFMDACNVQEGAHP